MGETHTSNRRTKGGTPSIGTPFVNFLSFLVRNVNLSPCVLFSQEHTCILDSLLLCNQTESDIKISLYIAQNESVTDIPDIVDYHLQKDFKLAANETIDWLYGKNPKFIMPNQVLYGCSDYTDNFFNVDISYRLLTEL